MKREGKIFTRTSPCSNNLYSCLSGFNRVQCSVHFSYLCLNSATFLISFTFIFHPFYLLFTASTLIYSISECSLLCNFLKSVQQFFFHFSYYTTFLVQYFALLQYDTYIAPYVGLFSQCLQVFDQCLHRKRYHCSKEIS